MDVTPKKAQYVSIFGLVLSAVLAFACWLIGAFGAVFAVSSLAMYLLAGSFVWLVLVIYFYQKNLAEQEKLDIARLKSAKQSDTIFQENEQAELLETAQQRLRLFEKWFLPIFSVILAVYEIAIGIFIITRLDTAFDRSPVNPQLHASLMVVVAFISLLLSRYATGMSSQISWKHLRAGGSYLLSTAVIALILAVMLMLSHYNIPAGLKAMSWAIPIVLLILGAEIILNVIFDIYRPRVPGTFSRAALDSRLLGLINEPGGVFDTFAGTLDYQFGFKVSQTWFYQLLEKAIIPLFAFLIISLYLLSCFIIINPSEQAVIEHFGSFHDGGRMAGPGLHVKLPWPFEKAYKYPVDRVRKLNVGYIEKTEDGEVVNPTKLLWGEEHYAREYNLLVATAEEGAEDEKGAVPVSLVRANVPVHYKIKDIYNYMYVHSNAEKLLEHICYRELVKFAVSSKIEPEGETAGDQTPSLLGSGRAIASKILTRRIQQAADRADLGVKIVFMGLQGVHPPPDVARDYQDVIGAVQKRQAEVLKALAEYNKTLTTLAGSVDEAEKVFALTEDFQRSKNNLSDEQIQQRRLNLNKEFEAVSGDISKTLSEAHAYAFDRASLARAEGVRFQNQLFAYNASPRIYKQNQRLSMLEESLSDIRKYILAADRQDYEVIIVDLQESLAPNLYDINLDELNLD